MLAPRAAARGEGEDRYVFVSEGGRARRRTVAVQAEMGDELLIGEGLRSGQRVVVTEVDALCEGQEIEEE